MIATAGTCYFEREIALRGRSLNQCKVARKAYATLARGDPGVVFRNAGELAEVFLDAALSGATTRYVDEAVDNVIACIDSSFTSLSLAFIC